MSNAIFTSVEDSNDAKLLIGKSLPTYRQAYSDRTSWLMACMSELAYVKFNPLMSKRQQKYFDDRVRKLIKSSKKLSTVTSIIQSLAYDPDAEKQKLEGDLNLLSFKLEEVFDHEGTQAILASDGNRLVLAFRGTEATSIKDIKADAKASLEKCVSKGQVHHGFNKAYGQVSKAIQDKLDEAAYANMPLYITGHSLGGALATIAAKRLSHKGGLAACYTFGSPRVGDAEWTLNIKTPIYRLVNAADCVTMLPPSDETITIVSWIFNLIPGYGQKIREFLLKHFKGYLHCGNMRYLTNCPKGNFENVQLLYSVSFFYRLKGVLVKKMPFGVFLSDHSIKVYRKKLTRIADRNNR